MPGKRETWAFTLEIPGDKLARTSVPTLPSVADLNPHTATVTLGFEDVLARRSAVHILTPQGAKGITQLIMGRRWIKSKFNRDYLPVYTMINGVCTGPILSHVKGVTFFPTRQ